MHRFSSAHGTGADWREAAAHCLADLGAAPKNATLGFLYVTDELAPDLGDVVAEMRGATGVPHWVGTVGVGICANDREYYEQAAVAVMLADLDEDAFRVFEPVRSNANELLRRLGIWHRRSDVRVAVVHGDPRNPALPELIEGVANALPGAFLVGGLSSSRDLSVQVADRVVDGGLSGVLLSPRVPMVTGLTQGCTLMGARHVVTECRRNIAVTIDDRPALDVFYDEIGEVLARDLSRVAGYIFAALPVPGSDTADYLVRNLVGIDPENKLLTVGDVLHAGEPIQFCRRDGTTAQQDLLRMLNDVKRRADGRVPRGALYFSCLGRGRSMFGGESEELRVVQRELADVPLAGFFANGEISHDRLYGYTGVLALFL